jgi:hypothetical protein
MTMGQIKIEIFEFALLIDHADGLTVLHPANDHILLIERDGVVTPVKRGADLELSGPGGAVLPAAPTTLSADYSNFVVDVNAAEGPGMVLPPALVDAATPPDPSRINGRLFLKGGTITGMPCSIPTNRTPFEFKNGNFVVTDTAVFTLPIPDGESYVLSVNGQSVMALPDGSYTRIANRDAAGCAPKEFETLDEFVALCGVIGHAATTPKAGGGPIRPMGGETVCVIAGLSRP